MTEKEVLDSLENPTDPKEKKYQWDLHYQQEILSMLLMDKTFLIQSMQLIKPQYFIDKVHETICSILFEYFKKYDQMPPKFVITNEIREKFPNDPKKIIVCVGELEALTTGFVGGLHSRDSCIDKITEFAKEQALRTAVSQTLDILEKNQQNKWSKIENIFREALLTDRSFDMGLDYFQTLEERYDRMIEQSKQKEVFVTGFDSIDDPMKGLSAGGLTRGEIGAFMGLSGSGKSLMLVKAAVHNIVRGKKVLYISLEMDQDKLAKRFDAMLSRENIRTLHENKQYIIDALKERVQGEEDKRKLIVKQFPAGTADVHTIRAYISQLNLYGFDPDLVCVDYVGEFKDDPNMKTYESRQKIVRDLRALGVEENHCTFTAMQSNRRGREQISDGAPMDDDALGDSFGQARPLDALWSINQSIAEKEMFVGRIFVVKHRDGRSRYSFFFKQDRDTLDIKEIDRDTHGDITSQYVKRKESLSEEKKLEKVISKNFKPNQG